MRFPTMTSRFGMVLVLIAACAAVALAAAARPESIIRLDFETPDASGAYRWALQTEGGIYHEQRGRSDPAGSLLVEGQYQYTAPDGQVIHVKYSADADGFHPTGAHLPALPAPPQSTRRGRSTSPPRRRRQARAAYLPIVPHQ